MTIELADEARAWLVKNGYDEMMGARPMARVIQKEIKTPLADEVLFGRLKNGGIVRVVVTGDDNGVKKLGFVYPEGPAQPRFERDLLVAGRKRATDEPEVRRANRATRGEDDPPIESDDKSVKRNATDGAAGDLTSVRDARRISRFSSRRALSGRFSAAAILAALAASVSLFSIGPAGGRKSTPAHRGRIWKWRWNTTCPPARLVELHHRQPIGRHRQTLRRSRASGPKA